jgi:pimeloyl-ACP methyl ester carboxylesterase
MPAVGRLRYIEVPPRRSTRPTGESDGTLLLIHGFPLNPTMWEPQFAMADRGWRVIAPELRGFGDGKGDPPAASVDDYAGDAIDLIDALHIDQAVVAGLSMGGYIAFAMWRHAPNYFRGLVLADTRPQPDAAEAVDGRKRMQQAAREKGPEAIADEMLPKLVGETTRRTRPDIVDRIRGLIVPNSVQAIVGALAALMTRPDSTPTLSTIRCPTLVIVGAEDTLTQPPLSESMHGAIPGSELVVIPGAGHMSNLEQPAAFNEALARFLDHRV